MPKFLRVIWLRWLFRKTPSSEVYDLIDVLQMGLRRCAYDLGHSLSHMETDGWKRSLHERLRYKHGHWLRLSNPKGIKQYQTEISLQIEKLEKELEKRRAIMEKHDLFLEDDIPF